MSTSEPFLTEQYEAEKERYVPFVNVKVGPNRHQLKAVADTGCNVGFLVDKKTASVLGLGDPNNLDDEPSYIRVADGHLVAASIYTEVEVDLAGEKKKVELYAVDPENVKTDPNGQAELAPLLGLGFMIGYTACFEGCSKQVKFWK